MLKGPNNTGGILQVSCAFLYSFMPCPATGTHTNANRDGFCLDHTSLGFTLQGYEEQHTGRPVG